MKMLPRGAWPVMLTPFADDLSIDWSGCDAMIEFYLQHGSAGLFAVCGSSETTHLSDDEKLQLAAHTVKVCAGRAAVVAGTLSDQPLESQIELVKQMAQTGVDAVVITTGQLIGSEADDAAWRGQMSKLLAATGNIPLGIYECPKPYHRLLPPQTLRWLADSGRFIFHKDTCCTESGLRAKIQAVAGTQLNVYNAHAPVALSALRDGAAGFCGVDCNFYPELLAALCSDFERDPALSDQLQAFMIEARKVIDRLYPVNAKVCMALRGVPISPLCRVDVKKAKLDEADIQEVRQLMVDARAAIAAYESEPVS